VKPPRAALLVVFLLSLIILFAFAALKRGSFVFLAPVRPIIAPTEVPEPELEYYTEETLSVFAPDRWWHLHDEGWQMVTTFTNADGAFVLFKRKAKPQ